MMCYQRPDKKTKIDEIHYSGIDTNNFGVSAYVVTVNTNYFCSAEIEIDLFNLRCFFCRGCMPLDERAYTIKWNDFSPSISYTKSESPVETMLFAWGTILSSVCCFFILLSFSIVAARHLYILYIISILQFGYVHQTVWVVWVFLPPQAQTRRRNNFLELKLSRGDSMIAVVDSIWMSDEKRR